MSHIIVVETLKAVPGKEKELKQALLDLVPPCLEEKGCLHYEIADPIAREGIYLVLMRMENNEALEAHNNSSHVAEFIEKYDQVLYDEVKETLWLGN